MTDPVVVLRDWLGYRRDLGDRELLLTDEGREAVLSRVADLASGRNRTSMAGDRDAAAARPARRRSEIPAPAPRDADLDRLSREAAAPEILALPDLARLRAVADACTRCTLHRSRTKPVFADGSPDARVLCVGEAPGQREDETGLPFVGPAGKLLDRLLLSVGLARQDVFICNVLKCRPPGNRNPLPEEIESCSPFLQRQIDLVDPEVIVAFGTFAARTLLDAKDSLGRLRSRVHRFGGRSLVATYHPAALLRNPGWIRPTWEDLQRVRGILDEGVVAGEAGAVRRAPATAGRETPSLELDLGGTDG